MLASPRVGAEVSKKSYKTKSAGACCTSNECLEVGKTLVFESEHLVSSPTFATL